MQTTHRYFRHGKATWDVMKAIPLQNAVSLFHSSPQDEIRSAIVIPIALLERAEIFVCRHCMHHRSVLRRGHIRFEA